MAGDNLLLSYWGRKSETGDTVRPLLSGSQLDPSSILYVLVISNYSCVLFFVFVPVCVFSD